MGDYVLQRVRGANELVQRVGPYVLLEVLLPGGTLFALLLLAYRRTHAGDPRVPAAIVAAVAVVDGWMARALDLGVVAGPDAPVHDRDGLEPLGL